MRASDCRHASALFLGLVTMTALAEPSPGPPPTFDAESLRALSAARTQLERQHRPATLPRAELLRQETILEAALSADGRHLAYLRRAGDAVDVVVRRIEDAQDATVLSSTSRVAMHWTEEGAGLWIGDAHGLVWFEADTAAARRVHKWPRLRNQQYWSANRQTSNHALIEELPPLGTDEPTRYWRVDQTGALALIYAAPAPLQQALLRADGSLAFTMHQEAPDFDLVIRHHAANAQRVIQHCRGVERCRLLQHAADGSSAWLASQFRNDLSSLQRWEVGAEDAVVAHRDPSEIADLSAVLFAQGEPVAAAYDDGRRRWHAVQPRFAKALEALQRKLPDAGVELSSSRDGSAWLVHAWHETWIQDRYFLYRPGPETLERLLAADSGSGPPPGQLAPMVPLHYRASDGHLLHGYVLLPRGRPLGTVPLIAWIHGGPVTREEARFDARLQLLANRGYAVFLPNFRGSEGFGIRYKLMADGDVGDGRVLQDVLEGLDLLLAAGIGDAARQAIMGHSFGGYLTLVALTHQPDRFRFAWAAAPPTDYGWTKAWQARHDTPLLRGDARPLSLSFPLHGFRFEDPAWRERMRRESPRANVDRIVRPVYLWAGAQDTHVPLASLAHYAGELSRLRKTAVLMVDPDAGHSPGEPRGAEAYLYLLEAASHSHLGGERLPPDADLQARVRRTVRLGAADLSR